MAATLHALAPPGRLAVLGFAAGGVLAPLRALGYDADVDGVDISDAGFVVFKRLDGAWTGRVDLHTADAADWLEGGDVPLAACLEDLSEIDAAEIRKPWASFSTLPDRIRRRLGPGGIALFNVLPSFDASWKGLLGNLSLPFAQAQVIVLDDYENRLLLAGEELPPARRTASRVRRELVRLGSTQAKRFRVRSW